MVVGKGKWADRAVGILLSPINGRSMELKKVFDGTPGFARRGSTLPIKQQFWLERSRLELGEKLRLHTK